MGVWDIRICANQHYEGVRSNVTSICKGVGGGVKIPEQTITQHLNGTKRNTFFLLKKLRQKQTVNNV